MLKLRRLHGNQGPTAHDNSPRAKDKQTDFPEMRTSSNAIMRIEDTSELEMGWFTSIKSPVLAVTLDSLSGVFRALDIQWSSIFSLRPAE